jgi:pyridoxal phosphate enzyme (YggS family)
LYDFGIREFAENREPELAMKVAAMPKDIIWHFIRPVQSNKIRKVVNLAQVIHSVESHSQLERFERIAGEENQNPQILLEVNVSGEESKYGIRSKEDLFQVAEAALSAPAIQWKGLMTMAPAAAEGEELRQVFAGLRQMRDELEQKYSVSLPELSMGMSGDYPAAIAEGATIVRIGTAIFGGRDYSK